MTQRGGCVVATRPVFIPLNAKGPPRQRNRAGGPYSLVQGDRCSVSSKYKGDIAAFWGFSSRHDNDMEHELLG